jgi:hypothetical protein
VFYDLSGFKYNARAFCLGEERFRFGFSEGFDELTITIVGPQPRMRPGAAPDAPAASRDIVITASRIKSTY